MTCEVSRLRRDTNWSHLPIPSFLPSYLYFTQPSCLFVHSPYYTSDYTKRIIAHHGVGQDPGRSTRPHYKADLAQEVSERRERMTSGIER
jgi:hypothetical protein